MRRLIGSLMLLGLCGTALVAQNPPAMDTLSRTRARVMLQQAHDTVKKHYYDVRFHGADLEARFREYDQRIQKAGSFNEALAIIADYLNALDDSHTYFVPPMRPYRFEYGYVFQAVGDAAFITQIRPGSDAAAKLNRGDRILAVNGVPLNRAGIQQVWYVLNQLAPQPATTLTLMNPAGATRQETVVTATVQGKRQWNFANLDGEDVWEFIREMENQDEFLRQRFVESGDVIVWKMPAFEMADADVDAAFDRVRKHGSLVLDLRGNPGGATVTLERIVGSVFDHDVPIGQRVGRSTMKPLVGKTRGAKAFAGKLVVLVDGASASAAELFARVVQLEKRGTVIGDRSSGSVMEARGYPEFQGSDTQIYYTFIVTSADLIMKDGKSLEHVGVTPDEIVLPTAADLAKGADPVLARAAALVGVELDPVTAGQLFPFEWRNR